MTKPTHTREASGHCQLSPTWPDEQPAHRSAAARSAMRRGCFTAKSRLASLPSLARAPSTRMRTGPPTAALDVFDSALPSAVHTAPAATQPRPPASVTVMSFHDFGAIRTRHRPVSTSRRAMRSFPPGSSGRNSDRPPTSGRSNTGMKRSSPIGTIRAGCPIAAKTSAIPAARALSPSLFVANRRPLERAQVGQRLHQPGTAPFDRLVAGSAGACSRDDAGLPRRPEARASGSGTGVFPRGSWQQGRVHGGKDRIEAALAAVGLGEGGAGLAGGKPRGSVPGGAAGEPAGPGPA